MLICLTLGRCQRGDGRLGFLLVDSFWRWDQLKLCLTLDCSLFNFFLLDLKLAADKTCLEE